MTSQFAHFTALAEPPEGRGVRWRPTTTRVTILPKAQRALAQLADPDRFSATYGLAYVARTHPAYRGDLYWRGAAWPQLNHLARVGAHRWGAHDLADDIAEMSRRGAMASGFSELWDPETGEARGAVPQTWAALAAVPSAMLR